MTKRFPFTIAVLLLMFGLSLCTVGVVRTSAVAICAGLLVLSAGEAVWRFLT